MNETDSIRITSDHIHIKVNSLYWVDGETHLFYCPSLEISAYGETREQASEMMKVSLETFSYDLRAMTSKNRNTFLLSLGWHKDMLKNKNFSHAFIDKNGVLQNLGLEDVEVSELQMVV